MFSKEKKSLFLYKVKQAQPSCAHALHFPHLINFCRLLLSENSSQQYRHDVIFSRFAGHAVSQWLRRLQHASTSYSTHAGLWLVIIRRRVAGFLLQLQFSCGPLASLWRSHTVASTFDAKSMFKPFLGKRKLVLSHWVR